MEKDPVIFWLGSMASGHLTSDEVDMETTSDPTILCAIWQKGILSSWDYATSGVQVSYQAMVASYMTYRGKKCMIYQQ